MMYIALTHDHRRPRSSRLSATHQRIGRDPFEIDSRRVTWRFVKPGANPATAQLV